MQAITLRRWGWVHKWSSLVCTLFILMLCLTGLPLVFSHEIEQLAGDEIEAPAMPEGSPRASVDQIAAKAVEAYPGLVPLYFFAEEDEPDIWYVKLDTRVDTDESQSTLIISDARTGEVLGAPKVDEGFMSVMYRLHVDLYAALPGKLFLGLMGVLLVVAIISGVVLYAPFMRRLEFAQVRHERSTRTRWLDLHNLIGVVTLSWALVVGITGVITACSDLLINAWRADTMASMLEPYRDAPPLTRLAPASDLLRIAKQAAPDMQTDFIAFPGTRFASEHHYAVFMNGSTHLTSHLYTPVLIDAQTLDVTAVGERPWYMDALGLSQPLHFGDYGGRPMQILWAVLDVLTIVVLGSGLYLWWVRRRGVQSAAIREEAIA